MSFIQYYKVGDKKFYNKFQAFDYVMDKNLTIEYIMDKDFIKSLEDKPRPKNANKDLIRKLILKGMKNLRRENKKLRLALGGGTDSWTILKVCMENDLYIDEVACGLVSFSGNVRADLEYLPALRYAKKFEGKLIGRIKTMPITKQSLEYVNDPAWFKKTSGPSLPIRPFFYHLAKEVMNSDKDYVNITGMDKPTILVENGQMFWMQMDVKSIGEWMGIENHQPLFYDKNNPELTIAMTYAFIEALPNDHFKKDGIYEYETLQRSHKDSVLDNLGFKLDRPWLNHHLLGKKLYDMNTKTLHFIKELKKHGQESFLDKWRHTMSIINKTYKDIPYGLETKGHYVKTVGRFSQKIPIYKNSFGKQI